MIDKGRSQSNNIDESPSIVLSLLDDSNYKENMISMQKINTYVLKKVISALYTTVIGYFRRSTTSSMLLRVPGSLRKS